LCSNIKRITERTKAGRSPSRGYTYHRLFMCQRETKQIARERYLSVEKKERCAINESRRDSNACVHYTDSKTIARILSIKYTGNLPILSLATAPRVTLGRLFSRRIELRCSDKGLILSSALTYSLFREFVKEGRPHRGSPVAENYLRSEDRLRYRIVTFVLMAC